MRPTFLFMDWSLVEEIKELALPLLGQMGAELVELKLHTYRRKSQLQFLVDKPGGITIDECARLNQAIGHKLDEQGLMNDSYILEVSSPGLDRPLVRTRDFQRHIGELAKVVLHTPINRQNVWIGFIENIDEEKLIIRSDKKEQISIARKDIAKVKLEVRP